MILLIVSLVLALLGNNYVLAQSSASGMDPGNVDKSTKQKKHNWFDKIDTNHDMKISQDEFSVKNVLKNTSKR